MTPEEQPAFAALPRSVQEAIERVCTRFEAAWQAGQTPRLQDYWAEEPAAPSPLPLSPSEGERGRGEGAGPLLFRELLYLELEYRWQRGETPAANDYLTRFPAQTDLIRQVWLAAPAAQERGPGDTPLPDIPGYELLGELGRGGMGVVYQARQLSVQRLVALKVIHPGLVGDRAVFARFQREALLTARLAHPHLVTVYDAGQVGEVPFFVMEFVEGPSLAQLLRERGRLRPADACELIGQAALGLQYVHDQGLVHRDLKPSNLLLHPAGQVKVVDLGLARLLTEPEGELLTSWRQCLGTADYLAPEQWEDSHAVDIRADLYSLGCTLYHLLAGRAPFGDPSHHTFLKKMWAHSHAPVAPIHQIRPDVPQELTAVLDRLLAKDRASRFATPGELARALQPFTAGCALPALCAPGPLARPADRTRVFRPPVRHVKVGVLHSLSGTMGHSETPVVEATLLAIEEINLRGGLLGRRLEPLVVDGLSDWPTHAQQAERLITQEQVWSLFGCWTSASRKTVRSVVEAHDHLLIYPMQYEGLEQSPNIFCTGVLPNQQVLPAVRWAREHLGRRFFLVGSDFVWPHVTSAIIKDEVAALGGEIVGEVYLPLGSGQVADLVQALVQARPEVVLEMIAGDSKVQYYRALRRAGITADRVPTVSFGTVEHELRSLVAGDVAGDYTAWSYFQSIDRPQNHEFVRRFQARYGRHRLTSDPVVAGYFGVHLWGQAVQAAGSDDVGAIRQALRGQSFDAPEGVVRIDPDNQHTWRSARIGRFSADGSIAIIWTSPEPIPPVPYPPSRSRAVWDAWLQGLFQHWGGHWVNPIADWGLRNAD